MRSIYKFLSLGLLILSIVTVIGCGKQAATSDEQSSEVARVRAVQGPGTEDSPPKPNSTNGPLLTGTNLE